jgi:hypothetical protein
MARMKTDATLARILPYESPPSVLPMRSLTAAAIAEATTTMRIATNALGSHATTPLIKSETGLGPQMPNASCRVNSRTA